MLGQPELVLSLLKDVAALDLKGDRFMVAVEIPFIVVRVWGNHKGLPLQCEIEIVG
jgi:hypothetical protein